jgi:NADPH:quinone reductase-like Zn-dependent oxidoreductase
MDLASTSFETTSQPTSQPTSNPKEVILVWGGSTVTGQFAIQIAAQAGLEVIAVCSDSTADLVSGLGATFVVTYTAKTDFHIIGEILCLARGRLTKAIDLVGEKTARLVLQVIAACGTPIDFAPLAFMSSKDPVPANAIVKSVEMKQFVLDDDSEKYGAKLNDMIEQKTLKVPKLRLLHGGLGAVEQGLKRIKDGDLAGEKLVVLM